MKYPINAYVNALYETARENRLTDLAIKNFITVIRRNRDTAKLPEITRRFHARHRLISGIADIEVISARDIKNKITAKLHKYFGNNAEINFKIDSQIISGVILRVNNEILIDASAKRRLNTMLAQNYE